MSHFSLQLCANARLLLEIVGS